MMMPIANGTLQASITCWRWFAKGLDMREVTLTVEDFAEADDLPYYWGTKIVLGYKTRQVTRRRWGSTANLSCQQVARCQ